MSRDFEVCIK